MRLAQLRQATCDLQRKNDGLASAIWDYGRAKRVRDLVRDLERVNRGEL